jgi:hypothetical protein
MMFALPNSNQEKCRPTVRLYTHMGRNAKPSNMGLLTYAAVDLSPGKHAFARAPFIFCRRTLASQAIARGLSGPDPM